MKTPHDRLEAVMAGLESEIEAAAISDRVLVVTIGRDGAVAGTERVPRGEFAETGDDRLTRPATVKPGEYAACWVLGHIEGVKPEDNPVARAGMRKTASWPPADLDDRLRRRTDELMPSLASAIRRASEADDVLVLAFTGADVWTMRKGLMPRADMVARGDTFCSEKPKLGPGEVWACWAIAVDTATGRYIPVRLSTVPETKGGAA